MKYLLTIIFGIAGLSIALVLILQPISINGEEKDCYDRHDNKIIGERCIVENSFDSEIQGRFMFGVIGFMINVVLITFGNVMDDMEEQNKERRSMYDRL